MDYSERIIFKSTTFDKSKRRDLVKKLADKTEQLFDISNFKDVVRIFVQVLDFRDLLIYRRVSRMFKKVIEDEIRRREVLWPNFTQSEFPQIKLRKNYGKRKPLRIRQWFLGQKCRGKMMVTPGYTHGNIGNYHNNCQAYGEKSFVEKYKMCEECFFSGDVVGPKPRKRKVIRGKMKLNIKKEDFI